jgi:beta-galactosidase
MKIVIDGPAVLLGYGNGNPGFKEIERPTDNKKEMNISAFNGKAQILVQSIDGQKGEILVKVEGKDLKTTIIKLKSE